MSMIVDENLNTVTKEEVLANLLVEADNKALFEKAKTLFKIGVYSKETVEVFDEEAHTEVYPKTVKGYSLVKDSEGNLKFIKVLKADSETDSYGYEVLSLPSVTDEELKKLCVLKRPCNVLKIVLLVVYILLLGLGLYSYITTFFDTLGAQGSTFESALFESFFYIGGSVTIGFGLLLLILKKDKKCCRK